MFGQILLIFGLILLNGLFSGGEIAILSIRKTRLAELADEGNKVAGILAKLRSNPERFLATAQVGITLVGVAASAVGGANVAEQIAPHLAKIPVLAPFAPKLSLLAVIGVIAYFQLILGELVPKSLALRYSEAYGLAMGRPLALLAWIGTPVVWFLTASSNLVLRYFGDQTSFSEVRLSREELLQLMDEAATAGNLDPKAGEIASRALEFDNLDASTLMVARPDMHAVPKDASISMIAAIARDGTHARLPVYDGEIDNIIGFVNVREVLGLAHNNPDFRIETVLHPVPFVPEAMPAPTVLKELQRRRSQMAVVVDEQGMVRGLVTMEDLVEELVGEIFSENEPEDDTMLRDTDGSTLVQGGVPVHEVMRELGVDLPEDDSYATVAGLCIHLAGRIPEPGTVLHTDNGVILEVVDGSPRRVRLVRIRRPLHDQPQESPES